MATKRFEEMTMSEMIAWYNSNTTNVVKKFADRKTAERRCTALKMSLAVKNYELDFDMDVVEEEPASKVKQQAIKIGKISAPMHKNTKSAEAINEKKAQVVGHRTLSEAIRESWKDSTTAVKRSARNKVEVDGQEYPSVRQAFIDLNLPLEKHIKFRMELKAAGKLKAFDHKWVIIGGVNG